MLQGNEDLNQKNREQKAKLKKMWLKNHNIVTNVEEMKAQLSHYWELIRETREVEGEEIKALEEQRDDIYELHHMNWEEFHHMLKEMHSMNDTQSDHIRYL